MMSALTTDMLPDDMMKNDMAYTLGLPALAEGLVGVHVALARGDSIDKALARTILEDHPMDFYLYFPFRAARIKSAAEEDAFKKELWKRRNHRLTDGYALLGVLVFGHLSAGLRQEAEALLAKDARDLAIHSSFPVEGTALLLHWGVHEGFLPREEFLALAERHEVPSPLLTRFKS